MAFIFLPLKRENGSIFIDSIHTRKRFQYEDFLELNRRRTQETKPFFDLVFCIEEYENNIYEIIYSLSYCAPSRKEDYSNLSDCIGRVICYEEKNKKHKRIIIERVHMKELEYSIQPILQKNGLFVNPYKPSEQGERFSKCSMVARLSTTFFVNYYFFEKVCEIPKRTAQKSRCASIVNVKRNCYFNLMRCMRVGDTPTSCVANRDEKVKFKKMKPRERVETILDLIIGYDCETILVNDRHEVYMIYAKILREDELECERVEVDEVPNLVTNCVGPPDEFLWFVPPDVNFEEVAFVGSRNFKVWVEAHINFFRRITKNPLEFIGEEPGATISLRIFGFNNNNFDNHLIYEDFRRIPNVKFKYQSRYNKLTSCIMTIDKHSYIELTDLIKWLPDKSLAEACEDYNIKQAKLDIDIVSYNKECKLNNMLISRCSPELFVTFLKTKMPPAKAKIIFKTYYDNKTNHFKIFDLITEYCKKDVESIIEIYQLIDENIKYLIDDKLASNDIRLPTSDFLSYISVPQLSFNILQETLRLDNEALAIFNIQEQNEFIIDSYFGGRTDYTLIGEYIAIKELEYFDVTSEYSLAMTGYFPAFFADEPVDRQVNIGMDVDIKKIQNIINNALEVRNQLFKNKMLHTTYFFLKELNAIKGIFRCNIYPPSDSNLLSTWSPVPTRIALPGTNKLSYRNHRQFDRILNTVQFRSLILAGWSIEILPDNYNLLFLHARPIFSKFINLIGSEKAEARTKNKTYAKLLKLVLNSAQGKLAQKPTHLIHRQVTKFTQNLEFISNEKYLEHDWVRSFHYLASFIGAEANWILWSSSYMLELGQIYDYKSISQRVGTICYCDTDSIIFDVGKASKDFVKFTEDEEIGVWDEQKSNFNITWKQKYNGVTSILVLAKKCYFLVKKQQLLNIKIKGLIRKEAEKLTYDKIKEILSSDGLIYEFSKLSKQAIKLNELNVKFQNDIINKITEEDTKRKITKDSSIFEVECRDDLVYEKNKEAIVGAYYKEKINHYLKFSCSQFYSHEELIDMDRSFDEKMEDIFYDVINNFIN